MCQQFDVFVNSSKIKPWGSRGADYESTVIYSYLSTSTNGNNSMFHNNHRNETKGVLVGTDYKLRAVLLKLGDPKCSQQFDILQIYLNGS